MSSCRLFFLFVIASVLPAMAGPITFGQWYEFAFDTPGSFAFGCTPEPSSGACVPSDSGNTTFADPPPWTFTAPTPATFTITDAFLYGDAFNVYDFGTLVLTTPAVAVSRFDGCGSDPDFCLTDSLSSHGSVVLAPGSHSVTIQAYQMAPEIGAAYFERSSSISPSSHSLLSPLRERYYWIERLPKDCS